MTTIALCSAVPLSTSSVPDWIHLLPTGDIRAIDQRGPYRVGDVTKLIGLSMAGGKLVLDENHSTDLAAPRGESAPARGWIIELQSRADGVWGRVEWTAEGKRIMASGEYRGVSPVIVHNKAGDVERLARASLTNTPNFAGLVTLHSASTPNDRHAALVQIRDQVAALKVTLAALGDRPDAPSPSEISDSDRQVIDRLGLNENAFAAAKRGLR